jgi:hypothetical protein
MTTDNFCFYLQNREIQTSQTGGQWYNDTSPFSIPWLNVKILQFQNLSHHKGRHGIQHNDTQHNDIQHKNK